jgi:hypothetical protein
MDQFERTSHIALVYAAVIVAAAMFMLLRIGFG